MGLPPSICRTTQVIFAYWTLCADLEPFQHKGSLEAEDAEMCDHGPSEPYDREAPCESHALTPESRDAIGVSPTPSLQCAMQVRHKFSGQT